MKNKIIEELKKKRYDIKLFSGDYILPVSWKKDMKEDGEHLDYADVIEILDKHIGEKK